MQDPVVAAEFERKKERLRNYCLKIKNIVDQGRAIKTNPASLYLFKGMYKELKPHYDVFNNIWEAISDYVSDKGGPSVFPSNDDKSLATTAEKLYYEGCAIYEEYMNPTPRAPQPPVVPAQADRTRPDLNESRTVRARLPQIDLPHFNGSPSEWLLFRDTYKSLIHDETTLSDMEKFLFLVSCLSGPARALIANVSLVEANYPQAWKVLTDYYNNNRKLGYTYLRQVLEFKPLTNKPTLTTMNNLVTSVLERIDSFKHLNIPDSGDFILSYLVLRCLDPGTKTQFEKKYSDVEFPTYQQLADFLKSEWKSMDVHYSEPENSSSSKISFNRGNSSPRPGFSYKSSFFAGSHSDTSSDEKPQGCPRDNSVAPKGQASSCPVCKSRHNLYQCRQFRSASAGEKVAFLKDWQGCTNCLSSKHRANECNSLRRCTKCNKAHHSWLHQNPEPKANGEPRQPKGNAFGTTCSQYDNGEVLLGTAVVHVKTSRGQFERMRILTDSGSQFSFMTADCALRLGLLIEPCKSSITGIGQVHLSTVQGRVNVTLRSLIRNVTPKEFSSEAIVVPMITTDLPKTTIPHNVRDRYRGYALADAEFWKPGPIDFLLGADIFFDILTGAPIQLSPTIPRLLPSIFGFIVAGPITSQPKSKDGASFLVQSQLTLKDILNKFWEVEEVKPVHLTSDEDEYCEKHFQDTHYRLESGRYVVSLPVRETIHQLKDTRSQTLKRLQNLETKLAKNSQLKREYHQFMRDYLDLGHMKEVTFGTSLYTLPHHAVVRHHDGQMKLRTVFDASCRSSSGSLNDYLYTGPKLQLDIRDILTNFRVHSIVFTADIVKMYRQIVVDPPDRKYQHILWRFDPSEAVKEYELCTVTYGQSSAPFDAQRTIVQLVQDEGAEYPLASRALREDIYVDDIVTGASSEDEAKDLQRELIQLLAKGCFELSKWASNCEGLLIPIEDDQCLVSAVSLASEDEQRVKLLGMQWIPGCDVFTYEVSAPSWNPSKRAILSAIARIYDPLGFLSPVVFYAKTILQDMWISKCGWDEPGPPDLSRKWHQFLSRFHTLSEIKIPRRISHEDAEASILVGFCDASQRGYSAVLYLRTETSTTYHLHLIRAKTKLAPIKPMTIPRLELSGALLLSELYSACQGLTAKLNISDARFFTDSQVVLGWLSTPPQQLNAFVAHRVVRILETTNKAQWNFVKSEHNPADCSSRGLLPSELVDHPLWWAGPQWCKLPFSQWPQYEVKLASLPERKGETLTALVESQPTKPYIIGFMERFSQYYRMVQFFACILRVAKRARKEPYSTGNVSLAERREADRKCIQLTQRFYPIDPKHLQSLHAFRDEHGLLRVGGRLHHSTLHPDTKHPIIIPGKSHYAKLLVDYYHRQYLHIGPTALQAMLQSRFWIVSGRQLIRQRVFQCLKCFKEKQPPKAPLMGNLPAFRLEEGKVFTNVGVDFGGPFHIRESLRRKAALGKAYLCLFICLTTKAVHLEVVSKCTTDAFLATFDRFVARRGKPERMFSDCGTNFIGAARRLKELAQVFNSSQTQSDICNYSTQREIQWSFNPPSAPHFGGIWEAGIKSAKAILYRVIGDTPLTFEELSTMFCNIEGVLNSRPITPINADPDCTECLTPGHFLIGRPLTSVPEEDLRDSKISPLRRWNIIQQRSQHFWKRWRTEYLHQLQQRGKWTRDLANLKPGDLVIVNEPNCPQRIWPMARVVSVHPGKDNVVRVATIKTTTGTYKRPVVKLVPLTPVNEVSN